jgi:RNA polymerase sigma-70 factor (ECF subfamily)
LQKLSAEQSTRTEQSDQDLAARCRRGEASAWADFFGRYHPAVGRFVFQLSPGLEREDVEEICQEVFLAAVRGLGSFRGGSAVQTWLFRIAANKARDWLDRDQAAKRGGGQRAVSMNAPDPESGLALDPASPKPGPAELLVEAERGRLLRQALDRLGDPCREIIELRYFGDLSYAEIAAATQLRLKTVSSRLSKCLDRLEIEARAVFDAADRVGGGG